MQWDFMLVASRDRASLLMLASRQQPRANPVTLRNRYCRTALVPISIGYMDDAGLRDNLGPQQLLLQDRVVSCGVPRSRSD